MNERFQKTLKREVCPTPPIWFMRQAGRYHSHYQELKKKYTFSELCKDPRLAAEVALGPIEEFDFDVSILFSDILFPLEALGFGLKYDPAPELSFTLNEERLKKLASVTEAIKRLEFQAEAVAATRDRLPESKSLIGFIGGPWTLFTYAMEGAHKGHLENSKANLPLFKSFCESLTPLLTECIRMQLEAGAEVIMIFDTAAGEVSPVIYKNWIAPELQKLCASQPGQIGYYGKGFTPDHYKVIADFSWAGLGYDHRFDLAARLTESNRGFLQGNFDQALLFSSESEFEKRLDEHFAPFVALSPEDRRGWVCGLGHGVLPKTPEANVKRLIQYVREVFR